MEDFAKFLRLHTADGDASPETIRSYYGNASQFVAWCAEQGINPAMATEDDIVVYRKVLVAEYATGTVAVKLAAIRRLYKAAQWRALRQDNPAAGLRAPKDKTPWAERVKFFPLESLRRLLAAPQGDDPAAVRDRAILALMGCHGLRVSEVAGLTVGSESSWHFLSQPAPQRGDMGQGRGRKAGRHSRPSRTCQHGYHAHLCSHRGQDDREPGEVFGDNDNGSSFRLGEGSET